MRVVAEQVALDPDHLAQPLLVEQMAGEGQAALPAPLVDLAVVGVGVEIGERVVEVVTDPGAVVGEVEEEVGKARPQIVPGALRESPEHVLGPGHDGVVPAGHEVVHGRFV